jgi:ketosteroid isomerase-like protein
MSADETTILELHRGFIDANKTGETSFLREHMAAGPNELRWYNLNQSNYVGVDHICELWDFLRGITAGGEAETATRDERVTVSGDAAWVTYGLHFAADFGPMGKVDQDARATEIWQRQQGEWRMVHFHCSNHVPGQMGGL